MKNSALPPIPAWTPIAGFTDIIYEKCDEGIAKITINRPEVRNAFRPETVKEMQAAFDDARDDAAIGVHAGIGGRAEFFMGLSAGFDAPCDRSAVTGKRRFNRPSRPRSEPQAPSAPRWRR